ncbi:DUF4411 family protein [Clostridium sp. 19966]|uniref:DUF4411 family protein n=1 Tax=Clostridium sp. 19966 TaxID=2768166 RepID=UPI0028DF4E24|nr:DUF4411 family protein [Clostridium sp. 19966]MDT8718819.1 DUF4411 family protein [Clostridium sp. 19966]
MDKYLLDTNVVIELWNRYSDIIDKLVEEKSINILKEIAEELVVKERRQYNGQMVLSERFCDLILFILEIDKTRVDEFYSVIEIKYSQNGKAYLNNANKLSENDLLLLYACNMNPKLLLVTQDKYLFNAAKLILGEDRVLTLKELVEHI